MKISFYAQVEIPVDERFSRSISTTVTLESEAILELAKAITAAQQTFAPDVCHGTADGRHLWQNDSNGRYCFACSTRR